MDGEDSAAWGTCVGPALAVWPGLASGPKGQPPVKGMDDGLDAVPAADSGW